jgi:molybdopterin molybdotransferase
LGGNAVDMRGVWRAVTEKSTDRHGVSFEVANFAWRTRREHEDLLMVSFHEALDILLKCTPLMATERCRLEDATGRVLRKSVAADRAVPAFDRVMMDGYALRSADWQAGHRSLRVTDSAPAGRPGVSLSAEVGTCVEVMTGAPCPSGADCIVPVEEVVGTDPGCVKFGESAAPVAGRFIHRAGSDAAAGQILLESGILLGSREIGVAASCGSAWLEVSRVPKIAVIATGDELVGVDEFPAPHQIRQSNAHSLAAALKLGGYPPRHVGVVNDEVSAARPVIAELLGNHDWLILTGAVSKGAPDFVPTLLAELGCRQVFHGVAQRPGKPAGCWIGPGGQLIMALPGNPVSALTGLHAFVFPALAVASGLPRLSVRRVVMDDRAMQLPGFTRHLPVTLRADGRAESAATGNSGDFIGLLNSDGFVTLPPRGEMNAISAAFPFTPWL